MAPQPQHMTFDDFAENLDRVFQQVDERNEPVIVERNGESYRLEKDQPADIWKNYDPERVKRALATSAGLLTGVDVEALLADLDAQREQGPNRFP